MTPAVRRLLREHGLEAAQIAGTGGGGRITREDVLAHVEAARTGAAPAARRQWHPRPPRWHAAVAAGPAPAAATAVPGAPIAFPPARTRSSSR